MKHKRGDIIKAADKGGWIDRVVTVLDMDLNRTKCLFSDGGYIVVDDAHRVTVLHIDENGFVHNV